jgi:hypothetical protein
MNFLSDFRALLIAVWLGAACFFSFAVAPSAFIVLRSFEVANANEVAGAIVNQTLMILNLSGLGISLILLLTSLVKRPSIAPIWIWAERFLLVLLTLACAVGQFVIGWWMSSIRAQIGKPLAEAAADDPLKIQFDKLHQYSVWTLMGAMAVALVLFFLIGRKSDKNVVAETKNEFKF